MSSNAVLTVLPTPPCDPAPSGLVGWWRGEENAVDRVGGNNGTLTGNVVYGPGKVGNAFVIGGDAAAVQLESSNGLQLQNFTIECWIQRGSASLSTDDGSGTGDFFAFGEGGYGFGLHDDGSLFLAQVSGSETDSSVSIVDTNFHHVAVTKSGTNVFFYLDGVPYPTGGLSVTFAFTNPAAIGARGDTLANSFLGIVDELSIYNQALSSNEIQDIYGARSAGKCVAATPILAGQPTNQTVGAYYPASFSALADGQEPLLYQWTFDGTNLPGATNSTLAFANALPSEAGTYSVIVGTAPNVTNSSNAILTVTLPPPPTILTQPSSHIGVAGDYTTFSVSAQSQAPVPTLYQWSFDGFMLTGATSNDLIISNLTMTNAGTYTVEVANPFYATNSQPAELTMIPAPTGTNHIVANLDPNELGRAIESGGSVTFVCNGTIKLPRPITAWQNVFIDGSNQITLSGNGGSQILSIPWGGNVTLRNLTLADGMAEQGGAITNAGTLNASNVIFSDNGATSLTSAQGGAIYNTGSMNLASVIFSNNYAWQAYEGIIEGAGNEAYGGAIFNTNGLVALTNVVFSGNLARGGIGFPGGAAYGGALCNLGGTIVFSNLAFSGNTAEGGINATIGDQDAYGGALYDNGGTIIGRQIACSNNEAIAESTSIGSGLDFIPYVFPATGDGGAFWLGDCVATLSNGYFVSNAATCTPAANEPTTQSAGGAFYNAGVATLFSVQFIGNSGTGANGVSGNTLDGFSDEANSGGPGEGGSGGGIYNVGMLTLSNCVFTVNTVSGNPGGSGGTCTPCHPPTTGPMGSPGSALGGALGNVGTVLIYSNAFLNNSASGPGNDVGTIYSTGNLQMDSNTVISPATDQISSNAFAPFFALWPASETVALGSSVALQSFAVGAPGPSYQWNWDGTNIEGATGSTLALSNIQLTQAGTYWVEAMNSSGAETSAPIVLTVVSAPSIANGPMSGTLDAGNNETLTVAGTGQDLNYQWQLDGTNIPGATASALSLGQLQLSSAGLYRAIIWNPAGAATSSVAIVNIIPELFAEWTGNALVLTWPAPYILQSATRVNGPYTDIPAASPYTQSAASAQQFYRLRAALQLAGTNLSSLGFSISGSGISGMNYIIEASTNLQTWQPLQTNTAPFNFLDANAPNYSSRFYRAIIAH